MRRTPLRRSSPKVRRTAAAMRALWPALVRRQGWRCAGYGVNPTCTRTPTDPHHLVKRSQGTTHDLTGVIALCRRCHDRAENVAWAQGRLVCWIEGETVHAAIRYEATA